MFLGSEALKDETRYSCNSVAGDINQWPHWESQTVFENLALKQQAGGDGDRKGDIYLGANLTFWMVQSEERGDFLPAGGERLVRCRKRSLIAWIASLCSPTGMEAICGSLNSLVQV